MKKLLLGGTILFLATWVEAGKEGEGENVTPSDYALEMGVEREPSQPPAGRRNALNPVEWEWEQITQLLGGGDPHLGPLVVLRQLMDQLHPGATTLTEAVQVIQGSLGNVRAEDGNSIEAVSHKIHAINRSIHPSAPTLSAGVVRARKVVGAEGDLFTALATQTGASKKGSS